MQEEKIIPGNQLADYFKNQVQKIMIANKIPSNEMVEFYLVNLLQEYKKTENLFEKEGEQIVEQPLALLLAEAMEADQGQRIRCLKKLGDTALYFSGFFADRIRKKLIGLNYYIDMGGNAYGHLSQMFGDQQTFAELYLELSTHFAGLVNVVATIANQSLSKTNRDILKIYERWLDTGNEGLRKILEEAGINTDEAVTLSSTKQ